MIRSLEPELQFGKVRDFLEKNKVFRWKSDGIPAAKMVCFRWKNTENTQLLETRL